MKKRLPKKTQSRTRTIEKINLAKVSGGATRRGPCSARMGARMDITRLTHG